MADSLGGEIGVLLKGFEGSFLYRFGWAAVIEKIFDLSSYVLSTSYDQIFRRTFAENGLFFFDFRRFSALDSLDL